MTSDRRSILLAALQFLAPVLVVAACHRPKDPPPMPSASGAQSVAQPPFDLEGVEDADTDVPEAGKKAGGKGPGGGASLAKCCAALRQNAESSPQKEQMLAAAGTCDAAVMNGSAAAVKTAVAPFAGGLPAGCL